MTDGRNLIRIFDHAVAGILKRFHNQFNSCLVSRHIFLDLHLVLASRLMGQLGTGNADPLTEAFGDYTLVIHIDQLIFQRRTSAVDN